MMVINSGARRIIWKTAFVMLIAMSPVFLKETEIRLVIASGVYPLAVFIIYLLMTGELKRLETVFDSKEKKHLDELEGVISPVARLMYERTHLIPVLVNQLKEVTDHTETAALDMGERFMSIVERARGQSKKASGAFIRFAGNGNGGTADTLRGIDNVMNEVKIQLDELGKETESLARDISSIVISMQFQDITRQRIEHVIEPLFKLKSEMEEIIRRTKNISEKIHELEANSDTSWLEKIYTMESERKVMEDTLDSKTKSGDFPAIPRPGDVPILQ